MGRTAWRTAIAFALDLSRTNTSEISIDSFSWGIAMNPTGLFPLLAHLNLVVELKNAMSRLTG